VLHGRISDKQYVQRVIPFAKADTGLSHELGRKHAWQVFDTRSDKILTVECGTQAKAWRILADEVRANGGYAVNHAGKQTYLRGVVKKRDPKSLPHNSALR
jgi:hypothetical protein